MKAINERHQEVGIMWKQRFKLLEDSESPTGRNKTITLQPPKKTIWEKPVKVWSYPETCLGSWPCSPRLHIPQSLWVFPSPSQSSSRAFSFTYESLQNPLSLIIQESSWSLAGWFWAHCLYHHVIVMSPQWLLSLNSSTSHSSWTALRLGLWYSLVGPTQNAGLPPSLVS